MKSIYTGKVWKFGDSVSTDTIAPGRYLSLRSNPPEFAKHVLEAARPEFPKNVQKGDFMVAGKNFGCGSSREIAPIIIKISGVGAIIAQSFGRIFYRNAVNNGMLLIQCDTNLLNEGDLITVDIQKGETRREGDADFVLRFALPEKEVKIIEAGGLLSYIDKFHSLNI
jgi:3-isopropylmalate/(R)-2-methylmalate dehydratase small subunit